jgi:hypothetical protein
MKIAILAVDGAVLAIAGAITKAYPSANTGPAAPASTKPATPPSNSLSGPVDTIYTR